MNTGKAQCQICDQRFTLNLHLNQHLKEAHVEGGKFICGECPCTFATAEKLENHQNQIHGGSKTVIAKKASSDEELHRCKFCGIRFHNLAILTSHQRRKHAEELESSEEEDEDDEEENVRVRNGSPGPTKLIEKEASDEDSTPSILKSNGWKSGERKNVSFAEEDQVQHISNDPDATSPKIIEAISVQPDPPVEELSNSNDSSAKDSDSSPFIPAITLTVDEEHPVDLGQNAKEADQQGMNSVDQASDIQKLINSLPEDDYEDAFYTCELCGSSYASQPSLDAHKKTNHVINGQFSCDQCSCTFASRPELIVHADIFHRISNLSGNESEAGIANFGPKIIETRSNLACELCGQTFQEDLQLTIHKVRNHVVNGVQCSFCVCTFMSNHDMQLHQEQFHDSFNISYTEPTESLPEPILLNIPAPPEMRTMTTGGNGPYVCEVCNEEFRAQATLKAHKQISHVQGGFQCPECPCSYSTLLGLKTHGRRHKQITKSPAQFTKRISGSFAVSVGPKKEAQPTNSYLSQIGNNFAPKASRKSSLKVGTSASTYTNHEDSEVMVLGETGDNVQVCSCEICGLNFISSVDYLAHKAESHVDTGRYVCSDCPCVFASKDALKYHKEVFHAKPIPMVSSPIKLGVQHSSTALDCQLCGYTLSSKGSLQSHMQRSHVPNGFQCNFCACSFKNLAGVRGHLSAYHRGSSSNDYTPPSYSRNADQNCDIIIENSFEADRGDMFKCNICDWVMSDATELQNHKISLHGYKPPGSSPAMSDYMIALSKDDPLTCSACNLTFRRPAETVSHKKRNHVPGGQFPCKLCKCVYDNDTALQAHQVTKHKSEEETVSTLSNTVLNTGSTLPAGRKEFVCNLCGRNYFQYSSVVAHKARSHKSHGIPCEFCTCVLGTQVDYDLHRKKYHRNQQTPTKSQDDKGKKGRGRPTKKAKSTFDAHRYVCQYPKCTFQGTIQSSLALHIKSSHAGPVEVVSIDTEERFKCGKCGKSFETKRELTSHQEEAHGYDVVQVALDNPIMTAGGKYSCYFCSIVFSRLTAMTAHVKTFHANESGAVCFECEDNPVFSSTAELESHRSATHGAEKHRAPLDDVVPIITSYQSLQGYVKPKQPQCELCGRVFFHRRSLWSHRKRSHVYNGNYGCPDCSCGFENARGLETHKLIYHGIRSNGEKKVREEWLMDCDNCGETFTSKRRMKAHLKRAHVEDGSFPCPDCYCIFSQRTSLSVHRIQNHGYKLPEDKVGTLPVVGFCSSLENFEEGLTRAVCRARQALDRVATFHSVRQPAGITEFRSTSPINVDFDDNPSPGPSPCASPGPASPMQVSPVFPPAQQSTIKPPQRSPVTAPVTQRQIHTCSICSLKFGHLQFLITHRKMRHGIEERRCALCQTRFASSEGLIEHIATVHELDEHRITFTVADTEQKFPCNKCGMVFQAASVLNTHRNTAHVPHGKYPCSECPCVFGNAATLKNHETSHTLRMKNKRDSNEISSASPSYGRIEDAPSKKRFKSPLDSNPIKAAVPQKAVARKKTSLPPRNTSSQSADIVGMALSAALNDETPTKKPSKPGCSICKRNDFTTASNLRQHEVACKRKNGTTVLPPVVKTIKSMPCSFCSKIFTLEATLRDHLKKKHGKDDESDTPDAAAVEEIDLDSDDGGQQVATPPPPKVQTSKAQPPKSSEPKRTPKTRNRTLAKENDPPVRPKSPTPPPPPPPPKKKKTKFPCKHCNIMYRQKRRQNVHHFISHSKRGTYGCDKCKCKFSIKFAQYQHMKYAHVERKKRVKKVKNTESEKPAEQSVVPATSINSTLESNTDQNASSTAVATNGTNSAEIHIIESSASSTSVTQASETPITVVDIIAPEAKQEEQHGNGKVSKVKSAKAKKRRRMMLRRLRLRKTIKEKGFFSAKSLRDRERLVNWTETMHPCKVCAMKFKHTKKLYRHERINHPGQSEYLCEKCPSMTSLSAELEYHEDIYHSEFSSLGEVLKKQNEKRKKGVSVSPGGTVQKLKNVIKLKPFRGGQNSPLDLSNVIASFTMPNGIFEEDYSENTQSRLDSKRRQRIRRFGIHTCRICAMMFLNKRGLSDHLKAHVGVKPYSCRFCKIQFRQYSSYIFHKKKHLSLRTIATPNPVERDPQGRCSHCQATFKTLSLADLHFEEVHPELKFLDMCEQASSLWREGELADLNLDSLLNSMV